MLFRDAKQFLPVVAQWENNKNDGYAHGVYMSNHGRHKDGRVDLHRVGYIDRVQICDLSEYLHKHYNYHIDRKNLSLCLAGQIRTDNAGKYPMFQIVGIIPIREKIQYMKYALKKQQEYESGKVS